MAFKGYTIDQSFAEDAGGGRPHLTEGYYLFEHNGITPSPEDLPDDKQSFWRYSLRIVEGPSNVGRTFPHRGYFGEKQFSHARVLFPVDAELAGKLAGRAVTTYAQHVDLASRVAQKVKGRRFGALVADGQPYQGRAQSELTESFDEAEFRKRVEMAGSVVTTGGANGSSGNRSENVAASADDIFNNI